MRLYLLLFAIITACFAAKIGLESIWGILVLCISILLFIITLILQIIVSKLNGYSKSKKVDSNPSNHAANPVIPADSTPGNYVYLDYESEPGFWAHNDSLFILMVIRKDYTELTEKMNTEEGWEITSSENSEPEGACMENETTMEVRRNGLQFIYNFSWKTKFEWLLQYDFVRLLYDRSYFERFLEKAQEGDANAQTLVGCCYGHNGKMAADVVTHNIEEALKWWHLAAEQGHKYAMREIALYHWHRGEKKEAYSWNKKGDLNIFVLNYHSKYCPESFDNEIENEGKDNNQA